MNTIKLGTCVACVVISLLVAMCNMVFCNLLWLHTKISETTKPKTLLWIIQGIFPLSFACLFYFLSTRTKNLVIIEVLVTSAICICIAYIISWLWMGNFALDDEMNGKNTWNVSGKYITPVLYPCAVLQISAAFAYLLWTFYLDDKYELYAEQRKAELEKKENKEKEEREENV